MTVTNIYLLLFIVAPNIMLVVLYFPILGYSIVLLLLVASSIIIIDGRPYYNDDYYWYNDPNDDIIDSKYDQLCAISIQYWYTMTGRMRRRRKPEKLFWWRNWITYYYQLLLTPDISVTLTDCDDLFNDGNKYYSGRR